MKTNIGITIIDKIESLLLYTINDSVNQLQLNKRFTMENSERVLLGKNLLPNINTHHKTSVGAPLGLARLRSQHCHCFGLVTAVAQVQSLALEFLHATGMGKKNKK